MITRDYSPIPYQEGKITLSERLRGISKFGFSWAAEMKSQNIIIQYLDHALGNSFALLRNVPLPNLEITIPLMLVGPHGVTVIYNSIKKGVFRAQGNRWATMDNRSGKFRDVKPNLITRTSLMARAVENYLVEDGFPNVPTEGVLALTHPGTHVDTIRPDVRVVLVDALDRFAAQAIDSPTALNRETRRKIRLTLTQHLETEREKPRSNRNIRRDIDASFNKTLSPLQRTFNFSRRQWLILGAFVVIEVIILIVFMLIILMTA